MTKSPYVATGELPCLLLNQVGAVISANLNTLAARLAKREFAYAPAMAFAA